VTDAVPASYWTTIDDPLARPLLAGLEADYVAWYGDGARQEMTRYPAERFARDTGGGFLLLVEHGAAVAGGAYMREGDDAEIKRMWTHPDQRRRGLARRVLAELQADALAHGYRRMVLSTGWQQRDAVALYTAAGWTPDDDLDGDWRERGWISFHRELFTAR
jgi:GNAT superfamily N-acetyltransferase